MHGEDSDPRPAREAFILWLESVCAEVRALEAQAEKELHDVEDEASYRETMRRKALLLSHRAYVLQTGKITMEGNSPDLLKNPEIEAAYLGGKKK